MRPLRPRTLGLTLLLTACATTATYPPVSRPLPHTGTAYAVAERVKLREAKPAAHQGIHNIYALSDSVISGSEPEGEEALVKLREMGVRTILSVDGKVPDHETARKLGIRYVHVPIRYRGITEDEMLAIAKTFRECEGPFYVHCFHGKHRGPAAAAVGRVVLDGAPREQAVAEMRQWCGTSGAYEGLYAAIAFGELPSAKATRAYDFDFAPAHQIAGFRNAMIEVPRSWDVVEDLSKRNWQPNPNHPDASARNEAAKLVEILDQCQKMPEVRQRPEDFRKFLGECAKGSKKLAALLNEFDAGDQAAGEQAKAMVKTVKASCTACHEKYRN